MTDSAAALQQQIDDLQGRLAYQEDLLQSLNQVISQQDATIQQLSLRFQQGQQKLDDLVYRLESPTDEKPPHY